MPQTQTPILILLKQCNSLRSLKQIHAQILTASLRHPNHLLSTLIRLRDLPYSLLQFSQIPNPNDFSFNVLIRALAVTWKQYPLALTFYLRMLRSVHRPNSYTYPFVLIALAHLRNIHYGTSTHCSILKSGFLSDCHVTHSLMTMYSRCGDVVSARNVFDVIVDRDLVSWNSMISGYSQMGFAAEAVELFGCLRAEGVEMDERTLASALSACGDLGDARLGEEMEGLVRARGLESNPFVGSAMIDMYGKCGDLGSARRVFDGIAEKELVIWNAMITGYAQNGMPDEAIMIFRAMKEMGMEPDKITMVGVLSACASVGALDLGSWLDDLATRKGLLSNVYVSTALIDMYAKCGNLDRALEIFEAMTNKNVVSWNSMISALASHGRGQEAFQFFSRMVDEEGVLPNDITFIGLLSACVHAGLVDKGRQLFNLMEISFGVIPGIQHYSCMVDLLARAGHLEEAWEFIEKMPEKPDAVVLGALLCACRKFRNVCVGERVMQKILEVEPSNSGNYVISSKIYAGSKMWDDSARMRGLMRERGVIKTPGCSWMEVDGQVHEFHAGGGLHPRAVEIDWMVDMLIEEIKLEGYTPDADLV